ncbi:MAG: MarR family transcriptional regulator [Clostridiales bacterium]|nr:MarR family transcriptional regulator [Clostridiales bacterium]
MELRESLAGGIAKLTRLKGKCYINLLNDLKISELSLKQMEYLKSLNKSNGVTTSHLAEILDLSKPTVTEMVKKFIRMEMVYKQSCPSDGRVYYIKLTEKGQQIVDLSLMTNDYLAGKLIESLSEEDIETLISILMKIE